MPSHYRAILTRAILLCTLPFTTVYADCDNCCSRMGGIQYCDSSAGRYVCGNGNYSPCYCTRHAVMDMQKLVGCCLWQGGVFKIGLKGLVICNDGSVSQICSIQAS